MTFDNSKKIYILLATYNGESFLKDQLESLILQTYTNWTIFIHDDNSTDQTLTILKEYQSKYQKKIILLEDNIATGSAKNNFTYLLNMIDDNFD